MKSQKQNAIEQLKKLTAKEKVQAIKWIDSLSEKELHAFSDLEGIELAQTILETFLRKRRASSKRKE